MTTRLPEGPSSTDPSTAPLVASPEIDDSDPPVTAVMTRDVVAVGAEARVPTAVQMMASRGVRHLPVVDRGQCVGMLVEVDLIRRLAQAPGPLNAAVTLTVGELRSLAPGFTFDLGSPAGADLTICANGKPIGKGQLIEVGEHLGVRVTEFSAP